MHFLSLPFVPTIVAGLGIIQAWLVKANPALGPDVLVSAVLIWVKRVAAASQLFPEGSETPLMMFICQ